MVCPRHPHPHVRLPMVILSVWPVLGIVTVLFFQCIAALFNPVHRRGERIKWWLVSYTTVVFSLATVQIALSLDTQSMSYIDYRTFSGINDLIPPGPLGYQMAISADALNMVPSVAATLNNWLTDGLLVSSLFDVAPTHLGI